MIEIDNFNHNRQDQTRWYYVDYEEVTAYLSKEKMSHSTAQNEPLYIPSNFPSNLPSNSLSQENIKNIDQASTIPEGGEREFSLSDSSLENEVKDLPNQLLEYWNDTVGKVKGLVRMSLQRKKLILSAYNDQFTLDQDKFKRFCLIFSKSIGVRAS